MHFSLRGRSAAAVASFNILMSLVNELIKNQPHYFRTVAIIYENRTSDMASDIVIALDAYNAPVISLNLDRNETIRPNWEQDLGFYILNICVLTNVTNEAISRKMYAHMALGSRHIYFSFFIEKAKRHEIDAFFRTQFQHAILKTAACFLGESIDIYTQFPYRKQFVIKLLEITPATKTWSPTLFDQLFMRKDDNLYNATLNIFISEDIPKAFRLPSRYRVVPHRFYFVGRDGYLARLVEYVIRSTFLYRTVGDSYVTKIANFLIINGTQDKNLYGKRLNFDDVHPATLTYVNLSVNEPIS